MEEEGTVATSCMASVARFLVPVGPSCPEFPAICHDPLFTPSPATPVESSTTMSNTSDAALMGNLLTDMLSTDFPYTGNSSRFSMPEILQFPASSSHQDQSSKLTLLQMLEESNETSTPYSSLKLPVLEEPCDQQKLSCSSLQQAVQAPVSPGALHVTMQAPPPSTPPESSRSFLSVNAEVKAAAGATELKACKVEPDSVPLLPQGPAIHNSSANSESSSDIKFHQAGTTSAGGLSQSSSGTETPPQQQQQRPKRKRIKSCKNTEEVESQRQTHIAVERNRRKQMNEHLNVLRSLMPGSYVQRGDQASIIGGAIEFVKELEQLLQCLQAQKRRRMYAEAFSPKPSPTVTSMLQQAPCPFSNPAGGTAQAFESPGHGDNNSKFVNDNFYEPFKEIVAEVKSEAADIEVKMVGSCDAVVKILSQRRPGQLLKTISALENMCMSIIHTNITTIEQTVLYSFTVKLAMEPRLGVEEIADAIQRAFSLFHSNTSSSAAVA